MREPDVEAIITFLKTDEDGRKSPCFSGYRPAHKAKEDYLTTGFHNYIDRELVLPGESVTGTITFITPEAYPNCLWEGKVITVQEGSRIIGHATITKIFNELLRFRE